VEKEMKNMLLKSIIELRNSIDVCRKEMYELKKIKDSSDPKVLETNQLLEEKISILQKISAEINLSQKKFNFTKITNNYSELEVS
jgi:hypothetical protein